MQVLTGIRPPSRPSLATRAHAHKFWSWEVFGPPFKKVGQSSIGWTSVLHVIIRGSLIILAKWKNMADI